SRRRPRAASCQPTVAAVSAYVTSAELSPAHDTAQHPAYAGAVRCRAQLSIAGPVPRSGFVRRSNHLPNSAAPTDGIAKASMQDTLNLLRGTILPRRGPHLHRPFLFIALTGVQEEPGLLGEERRVCQHARSFAPDVQAQQQGAKSRHFRKVDEGAQVL